MAISKLLVIIEDLSYLMASCLRTRVPYTIAAFSFADLLSASADCPQIRINKAIFGIFQNFSKIRVR